MFEVLDKVDRDLRKRVERVADTAVQFNDKGVFDWAIRAVNDALVLGRVRDRDLEALERLENTYGHEFYRENTSQRRVYA